MSEQWISASDALRRIEASSSTGASWAICRRARDGMVLAKAKLLIWGRERRDDSDIPAEFWWAQGEAAVRNWAERLAPFSQADIVVPSGKVDEVNLAEIELKLLARKPAVRERVSKSIERGSIGARLKRANSFRCQICDALGMEALGFLKPDGEHYVEAHHVTPVSALEIGSLSATNIMIVCANHHRQLHFGAVKVERQGNQFILTIDAKTIAIRRFALSAS